MSDFFHAEWSWFVALGVALSLLACLVLLFVASRRKVMSNDNSTGHVWDGDLRELNNPLPRWWMGLFVLTVVFAGVYLAFYPGLGSHPGRLGWSSAQALQHEAAQARAQTAKVYAAFQGLGAAQLVANSAAMGMGERLFLQHCAACHGSDARGSKGYPNLTDTDWLWGGSPERIEETIREGRQGVMPPMAAAVGSPAEVRQLAHYVLSLSGSPHDAIEAAQGRPKFMVCAACHGPKGEGNPSLGAPNLSDKVWLHGWGVEAITAMVMQGKHNVMPAHASRLSPEQIKVLSVWVWGRSQSSKELALALPTVPARP